MRTKFMKKFNKAVLVAESESVSSLILPPDVHGGWGKIAVPRVPDVLADAIEQLVHREWFKTVGVKQDVVGEQGKFFIPANL